MVGLFSVILLLFGWGAGGPSGGQSDEERGGSRTARDTSLFAEAVRWIEADLNGGGRTTRPLRVDPRPLRPGAELSLDEGDFAPADSLVHRRKTVLRRLGVPQRDALVYSNDCLFACDPRLVKHEEAGRVECPRERCEVTVVALGLPVGAGAGSSRDGKQKTIRVFRLTALTHFVHDLTFRRTDHGWVMVGKNVVGGDGM